MGFTNTHYNYFYHALIPFVFAIFITALNLFLNISPITIILYITGAGLYFLYSVFSTIDNSMNSDYLFSGEGTFSILFFFISARFLTENIFISFPLAVISLSAVIILIQKFYSKSATGFILNPLAILIIFYMLYFDRSFSIILIKKILAGSAEKNLETIVIFSIIFLISLIFIIKYRAAGIVYSHGKKYSENNFKIQTLFHYIFLFLKSLQIVSVLYLTGIAGFAAYYIYRHLNRGKINISLIFYFIFFHLAVLLSLKFADPLGVSAAVIILSAISHFIYKSNKVEVYDRSIRYKL